MFRTVLSKNAYDALALLGKSKVLPEKTFLAGGTALTLQIGHRISQDFDFFTSTSFKSEELINKLNKIGSFTLTEKQLKDTLLGFFNGVKFSIFLYPYPLIDKPTNDLGIDLASLKDIAAMKLAAIMDRGTKRDFIDLYFLIKNNISLDKMFVFYDKKFKALEGNLYSLLKYLTYFDDAEKSEMPEMLKKVSWEEVKNFFKKEVVKVAKKWLFDL
jgi:predicted nucleotidyltransferase component of viral defense system